MMLAEFRFLFCAVELNINGDGDCSKMYIERNIFLLFFSRNMNHKYRNEVFSNLESYTYRSSLKLKKKRNNN